MSKLINMKIIFFVLVFISSFFSCSNQSVNQKDKIIGKWQCYKFTMGGSEFNPKGAKYYNEFYWHFNRDTFIDSTIFFNYSYDVIDSVLYINKVPKCDIVELNDSILVIHQIEKFFKEAQYQKLYYFKRVENFTFTKPELKKK